MRDTDFESFLQEAREYLWTEIEPRAADWDEAESIPREELWPEFAERGFLGCRVPEAYGGLGLSHEEHVELEKEWAKVSGGLRLLLHVHNVGAELIATAGSEAQRERLLPRIADGEVSVAYALTEPHAGSGRDIQTTARREGDRYVLNGQKHHVSNGCFADLITVVCRTDGGFTNVMVPRDAAGLTVRSMPGTMGHRGVRYAYLELDDCEVPVDSVVGRGDDAIELAVDRLTVSRIYIAANALGIAERCLESSLDWVKKRVTFGEPIAERQLVRRALAEMARDVYTLRLAVTDAARRVDETGAVGIATELSKLLAIDVSRRVTDEALVLHGGLGYYREFPIERLYRDARQLWTEEGPASVLEMTVADGLLSGRLPYEPSPEAASAYDLSPYDPDGGNDYDLSYE